jgi:xylulose-5-phosphate/fructose-6-phosphate phosphoketolase
MPTEILTTEDLLHETPDAIGNEESLKGCVTLAPDLLRRMNAYWRAANYVSVGQIYLYENPLLTARGASS